MSDCRLSLSLSVHSSRLCSVFYRPTSHSLPSTVLQFSQPSLNSRAPSRASAQGTEEWPPPPLPLPLPLVQQQPLLALLLHATMDSRATQKARARIPPSAFEWDEGERRTALERQSKRGRARADDSVILPTGIINCRRSWVPGHSE